MPKSLKNYVDQRKALEYRNKQRQANYNRGAQHNFNGDKEWSSREINLVLAHKISDAEIAKQLGRTVRAIQLKRYRLRKGVKRVL
jgi:hypothetical protein